MSEVILEGDFTWIKCNPEYPEVFEGPDGEKKSWSATIHPVPASLEKIREMQADGIKNKLKRDEKGWFAKFSIPTEKKNKKTGKVIEVYKAPTIVDNDGKVITDRIANGAKGFMKLNFYEHKAGTGTSFAARLVGLKLTDWKPYGDGASGINTEVKQENYF